MTSGELEGPRVPAALLQETCRALLPGYAQARREPERLALLTTACLTRATIQRAATGSGAGGHASQADVFDELARAILLHGESGASTLFVADAEHASDVLCALWLARRCGLFQPGSSTAEASGKRSRLELVPVFARSVTQRDRAAALAGLYANAAFRRHLEARGRARMLALAATAA